jgi:hypothetical protein
MPRKGFELTTSVFDLLKEFHASDRTATVVGKLDIDDVILLAFTFIALSPWTMQLTVYLTSGNVPPFEGGVTYIISKGQNEIICCAVIHV